MSLSHIYTHIYSIGLIPVPITCNMDSLSLYIYVYIYICMFIILMWYKCASHVICLLYWRGISVYHMEYRCLYIYIYIYTSLYLYIYIHIYMFIIWMRYKCITSSIDASIHIHIHVCYFHVRLVYHMEYRCLYHIYIQHNTRIALFLKYGFIFSITHK